MDAINTTKGETKMRKHAIQMTEIEKNFLAAQVGSVASWKFTMHAQEKMAERRARQADVTTALLGFEVIEFNGDNGAKKILVRGKGSVNGRQVCAVLAPTSGLVVTVYFNSANDKHNTLNMAAYNKRIDVVAAWQNN